MKKDEKRVFSRQNPSTPCIRINIEKLSRQPRQLDGVAREQSGGDLTSPFQKRSKGAENLTFKI